MNAFIYSLLVCIALCLILIWYINIYNRYQNYIIRINEAEANIDSTLRKRFDLLNKSIGIIKANIKKENALDIIVKLRSKKLTNFELDRKLYDAINEFNKYKEDFPDLKTNEGFMKIELGINETEAEVVASRKYYNDIITDYNKLVRTFPSNVVAKISKYKPRPYFDGKNMDDDIVNDFKL
ncbi:MAG: LemA family protein [Firmicutes bacterium]|nr:LemA family protein [Bacillota bacterium]